MNTTPTEKDLKRHLMTDLAYVEGAAETWRELPAAKRKNMPFHEVALEGWGAALRRLIVAEPRVKELEAENERLRGLLDRAGGAA